jgi:hypothetical protein
MFFNRDSTIQKCTVILHCFSSQRFQFPAIRPDNVSHRSDALTDQASSIRTTCIPVRTFTVSRSYRYSLRPSGRFSSPSERLSVIDQLQILSKFNLREDCFNRPDDVDSRPDALLYKARIAIQISLSGRQSALVRTHVHQLRKLSIRLQSSGRLPFMVRTRALQIWKLRVEDQPSGRSSPMVRTREAL